MKTTQDLLSERTIRQTVWYVAFRIKEKQCRKVYCRTNKDSPLINGFARLRSQLSDTSDFNSFNIEELLSPFFEVISSPSTTGLITSMALSSISKFFSFGLVNKNSNNVTVALNHLATSITHCRFEATDQAEDDGVLLRILALMDQVVCGEELGSFLTDESLCEIVETCLSMACQMRRGELLRRAAEMTMIKLTESVFLTLKSMDKEQQVNNDDLEDLNSEVVLSEPGTTSKGYEDIASTILLTPSKPKSSKIETSEKPQGKTDGRKDPEKGASENEEKETTIHKSAEGSQANTKTLNSDDCTKESSSSSSYGLSSVREVFRVLISILDPSNSFQYTDSTRIMSLRVLTVAFEVSGSNITEHASLRNLTVTTLTKHLFQMIRTDNSLLLQAALRTTITVLHTCGKYLKLHQEFFFTYLITCLCPASEIPREMGVDDIFYSGVPTKPKLLKASRPNTAISTPVGGRTPTPNLSQSNANFINWKSPEVREVMVESLTTLVRSRSFFTDLFVNYDCDVNRSDLCEDLIGFFCRSAYPDSAIWSTPSVPPLCLEAILNLLSILTSRLSTEQAAEDEKSLNDHIEIKARKKMAIAVADIFNKDPKEGIKALLAEKFIPDNTPKSIAIYLRESERVNKTVLGEFLSKPSNKEILYLFIEDFDFSNKRLDEALREFLSTFRLPGESQQIERIFEKFAEQYCIGTGNTEDVANNDSAFVLSYAVIMLNTDLYNPQVKRHMTLDQFKKNLTSANNGTDFREEYLEEIYRAIKVREIVMPDEHDNDESFEYSWKGLLMKFDHSGDLTVDASRIYDKYLFENSWQPIITTLSFVFATATDDTVVARVITGFIQAANIAQRHSVSGVIDRIIGNLAMISTLNSGDLSIPTTNLAIEIEGEGSITVSDLSVPFGSDFKAQMATVTLFRIARSCTEMIGESGWNLIFPIMANLYLYDLIKPSSIFLKSAFTSSMLPRTKPHYVFKRSKAGRDVGLFSTISSYLSGYNDNSPQEPSDDEIDATYSAIDCVKSCQIGEFFSSISDLDEQQFVAVVDILISKVPRIIGNSDNVINTFSPTVLFYLEMAVRLAMKDSVSIERVGAKVQAALYVYIMKADGLSDSFLTKIVFYILSLLKNANEEFVEDLDMILKNIGELDEEFLISSAPVLLNTILDLGDGGWSQKHSICSSHYFYLLRIMSQNRKCSQEIYKFLTDIVRTGSYIDQGNIRGMIDILGQISEVDIEAIERLPLEERDIEINKSLKALDTMFSLGALISDHVNLSDNNSLFLYYIQGISIQCANANNTVRSHAIGYLQQIMLAPNLKFDEDQHWLAIFDKVLFRLIEKLLKPEIYELDPKGMAVTRLQCATLLCKVFLAFIVSVNYDKGILNLWIRLLETLDRLLNSGQRDSLNESVVEALKNVLLVLRSSEFGADDEFWKQTWSHIDLFLPGLHEELFSEEENSNGKEVENLPEEEKENNSNGEQTE